MTGTERLAELSDGKNPRLVLRLRSGFVVMADNQWLPGYCLHLAYPEASQLNDLSGDALSQYLNDLAMVGEAVLSVTECKRINYGIYGNVDPFLHGHIVPRYDWEVPEYAAVPPLSYPEEIKVHPDTSWDPQIHRHLQDQIRMKLLSLIDHHGHVDKLHH